MLNLVIERLNYLNYKVTQSDLYIIKFLILKEENIIKIDCNITDIPEELSYTLVDRIVGNFLQEKKIADPESLNGIDLDARSNRYKRETPILHLVISLRPRKSVLMR